MINHYCCYHHCGDTCPQRSNKTLKMGVGQREQGPAAGCHPTTPKNLPLVLGLWTPFLRQHFRDSVCRRASETHPSFFVGLPGLSPSLEKTPDLQSQLSLHPGDSPLTCSVTSHGLACPGQQRAAKTCKELCWNDAAASQNDSLKG